MSSFWVAIQQRRPETAHQQCGEALLPKTRRRTMYMSLSTTTVWWICQIGCAGRLRKAEETSDLKRMMCCMTCFALMSRSVQPKGCISSYCTLASDLRIPSLRPDAEWSVMTRGFSCQTTNIGEIFMPGSRFEKWRGWDQHSAEISLSWKARMMSRSNSSVA